MATLKQHQAAMVNLLANGTAIPTSAVRLAHALHDVLAYINGAENAPEAHTERRSEATTSGLNDAALAYDIAAVGPKQQQSLESLLKQRDNTIRQLRESNKDLRDKLALVREQRDHELSLNMARENEQSGCRKEDTQATEGGWVGWGGDRAPVDLGATVQVRWQDGDIDTGPCSHFNWGRNCLNPIVAYRVVGESK